MDVVSLRTDRLIRIPSYYIHYWRDCSSIDSIFERKFPSEYAKPGLFNIKGWTTLSRNREIEGKFFHSKKTKKEQKKKVGSTR